MPQTSFKRLERKAIDQQLTAARQMGAIQRPDAGWLAAIRNALGMSLTDWSRRLRVSDRAAAQMEKRERDGAITLNNLEKAAEALGCHLVYALVPQTSLEEQVQKQAEAVAREVVADVGQSMALEDQATESESREERVRELAAELLRRNDRRLWSGRE